MKEKNILASFGLTVGLVSGAIAAYLLAPQKGKDTQKMLVCKANRLSQKSIKKIEEALIQLELTLEREDKY